METLEVHTLICTKDVELFEQTIKLFLYHTNLNCNIIVHEDGSLTDDNKKYLKDNFNNLSIIDRQTADEQILKFLEKHELCSHFRSSIHHTIFKVKLFDIFCFSQSHNLLYLDSDILFCKSPTFLLNCFQEKIGCYLKDTWSAYCVPFRDEDEDKIINRNINAGLVYYPTKNHFNLDEIENCLKILYDHGSRGATHPFLEQTCIAYMITQLIRKYNINFKQLPHPDYCIPTFNDFVPNHDCVALHLNSSPLVGKWRKEHYEYEMSKIF